MDNQPEKVLQGEIDHFLEVWAGVEGHAVEKENWEQFALGYFLGSAWAPEAAAQMVTTLSFTEPFSGYSEA